MIILWPPQKVAWLPRSSSQGSTDQHMQNLSFKHCNPEWCISISPSQNAIYFSIIAIPKKSYFTIFAIQNFVQNTKNMWITFILLGCLLGEWCLVDCFHHKSRVSNLNGTQLLHCKLHCIFRLQPQAIFLWLKIFALITTQQEYGRLKKRVPSQVFFTDFVCRCRTAF